MIKAVIFDLDMCICDTRTVPKSAMDPVLKILYKSNLSAQTKNEVETALWNTSWDDIINIYSIPEPLASQISGAYALLETPDGMKTFEDEYFIKLLKQKKILVTSGYIRFQCSKIEKLNIADLFDEIIIDASDLKEKRKGKASIFREILDFHQWGAGEVIVLGDNPHSELDAAKKLGIKTVQTLRPTVQKWDDADYYISSLSELEAIISAC